MAQSAVRMDEYMLYASTAETCGVPYEWLSPAQIKERGGWILGPYEENAPARFEYAVPDSFRADLFPLELDRIEEEYLSFIHRIPSTEEVGLKDDYNGPICYTPDGNPLIGTAPGLRNMRLGLILVRLTAGSVRSITAPQCAGYL